VRRVIKGGLASALAVVGLVAFATPAFAHSDIISASASCSPPLGSGFTVTWTIQNNFNLAQTGSVTSITYGLSTLNHATYSIAASPGEPYSSTTLTQTLPATASGTITMDVSDEWSDGFKSTLSSSYNLSLDCAAPVQTIAGHIYLCNDGNPTTTEESGGTLAASGPTTVPAAANPLAPTSVPAGGYTMTATSPPGFQLVPCGGSSTPDGSGSSATEPVTVPSGGAGVGIFYVTPLTQTIAGHIYLCNAGAGTTNEVSGGTLAASGPTTVPATANPLAPTSVGAGGYTMTATTPKGYTLVTCGGSSTPMAGGSSATEPVTVPSGGAGVGIFYVAAPVTQAAVVTSSGTTTPSTSTISTATSSQSTPGTVSTLAATGAGLSWEWLIGVAALLLGSTMVITARRRRPRHQAPRRLRLRHVGAIDPDARR
jgi:hypothetical protein